MFWHIALLFMAPIHVLADALFPEKIFTKRTVCRENKTFGLGWSEEANNARLIKQMRILFPSVRNLLNYLTLPPFVVL